MNHNECAKPSPGPEPDPVLRLNDIGSATMQRWLAELGLELIEVEAGASIPGSFWGDEEAGLIANRLYARPDTPLHSILHETCHWLCMDEERRNGLHTNAGGDYAEESAVCYLQILLADRLPGFGRERCMNDMDAWGYSFRLGSTRAWFSQDAEDALAWLLDKGLLSSNGALQLQARLPARAAAPVTA